MESNFARQAKENVIKEQEEILRQAKEAHTSGKYLQEKNQEICFSDGMWCVIFTFLLLRSGSMAILLNSQKQRNIDKRKFYAKFMISVVLFVVFMQNLW